MNFYKKFDRVFKYIPRPDRLKVNAFNNVEFIIVDDSIENYIEVKNISLGGLGLSAEDFNSYKEPKTFDRYLGHLKINSEEYPVEIEIIHHTESIVGCQILYVVNELKDNFSQIFHFELLGKHLTKVKNQITDELQIGKKRVWNAGEHLSMVLHSDGDDVLYFELITDELIVQLSKEHKLCNNYFKIREEEINKMENTNKVSFVDDSEFVVNLNKILSSMDDLETNLKDKLLDIFSHKEEDGGDGGI